MSGRFIVVAGGVHSGIGKGVSAASMGLLMKCRGQEVDYIKFDPYLNINAGVLAPREHGECFLCDDGTEADLDLGHIERIIGITVGKRNICTSGTIHNELIDEQQVGKYLGQTIQVIPHFTNKVIDRLEELSKNTEIVIAEIGGTVGDIESSLFFQAIAQFKQKYRDDCMIAMVAPILWVPTIKEWKTKPLQRSVIDLRSYGLQPDMLICRVERPVNEKILDKISNLSFIPREAIFEGPHVDSIYKVPLNFYASHVDDFIADRFHLKRTGCRIQKYRDFVETSCAADEEVNIGIFGKYENTEEAYKSLKEAVNHAGMASNLKINIIWKKAEDLEAYKDLRGLQKVFEGIHGIIIPGGFDSRGVEGKIKAIRYAREKQIPFLGICLGLQCAVIEFARHVCGIPEANSLEFDKKTQDPVVHFVAGQENLNKKLSTMRLGAYECEVEKGTLANELYGKKIVSERHRHRYEINNDYASSLQAKGFVVSGRNPDSNLIEIMELKREIHPFFIGTQAHPEFRSQLLNPAPLFHGLVKASRDYKNRMIESA